MLKEGLSRAGGEGKPAGPDHSGAGGKPGGANRNRTDDLLNAIQALSQLSYGPPERGRDIAAPLRLRNPPWSGLRITRATLSRAPPAH